MKADGTLTVPPSAVTVSETGPGVAAGSTAVIWVELFTVNEVAGLVPKNTLAVVVKLAPVIVTVVPPATGPLSGLSLVTVGGPT